MSECKGNKQVVRNKVYDRPYGGYVLAEVSLHRQWESQ